MDLWFGIASNRIDLVKWRNYSVPADRLQQFSLSPLEHGPKQGEFLLDTSADSPTKMVATSWNRIVIEELVNHATEAFNDDPSYYANPNSTIDWNSLFKDRIYRHLLTIHQAKQGTLQGKYLAQKNASQRRSARDYACAFLMSFLLLTSPTEA